MKSESQETVMKREMRRERATRFCCRAAAAIAAITCGACLGSYQERSRSISLASIKDLEATRIYNFMGRRIYGQGLRLESRNDFLMDEVAIASLDRAQVCFDAIVRSEHGPDLHPSQWRIRVNGQPAAAAERSPANNTFWTTTERGYKRIGATAHAAIWWSRSRWSAR